MIIGVDVRVLTGKIHSGVEEYTINILKNLINIAPHVQFKFFLSSFKKVNLNYEWLNRPNVEICQFRMPNRLLFFLSSALNYPKFDKLLGGADVFFSPHFFVSSLSAKCKSVITFHDLSFMHHPEFFTFKKNIFHGVQMNPKKQAKRANAIIAVSESTKSDLINIFGIDRDKIKVIYSGINDIFSNPSDIDGDLARKYDLPEKYILFLGTFEPRKNLIGTIKAFEILAGKKSMSDHYLVLAGNKGWLSGEIFKLIKHSPVGSKIKYIGPLESAERPFVYRKAKLFVYPTFFEGFGFPVLEAMACGVPVVTSNCSSLPEVAGDGALLVNPYDVTEIADAMELVLSNGKIHSFYADIGKKRSNLFSWKKSAQETLDLLISL